MSSIYNLIDAIANTGSSIKKVELLKNFDEPELLKKVLLATYDYNVVYGIKEYDEPEEYTSTSSLEYVLDQVLPKLNQRVVTGNAARFALKFAAQNLSGEDAQVLRLIIGRDLKCGISGKTINKAFNNLIPIFELMACHTLNKETEKHLELPCLVQLKYDAARVCVIATETGVKYMTRNGNQYFLNNPTLDGHFMAVRAELSMDVVFDGELYQIGEDGKPKDRKASNGTATRFIRDTASQEEHDAAWITVWDIVPLVHFNKGFWNVEYSTRFEMIEHLLPRDMLPETQTCHTLEQIREISTQYIVEGQEGIIAKNTKGFWRKARVYDSLKVKNEVISTFKIVGLSEGTGKNEGRLGFLSVASECGKVWFDCGIFKGFPEGIRDEIWQNKQNYIGGFVDILHNGVINNKDSDKLAVFLPRVVEFRFDKDEADDLNLIKAGN